ncbi:MAG: aldehyde dehydrogenase family protein [Acidimicrobiales bacterium]
MPDSANGRVVSRSPQRPSEVLADLPEAGADAVAAAARAARAAQAQWYRLPAPARAQALSGAAAALEGAAGELVELGITEVGKPRSEMVGEVSRGVNILRYYAQAALDADGETYPSPDGRSLLMARRRPHGLVGIITPWNFPVAIPLWKAAPALAYGNAVLMKPSPEATAVAMKLHQLLSASFPDGLLGVVAGDAGTGRALLDAVDAVSFTGSVAVGHEVAAEAARRGVPAQAEMGGQNPTIVLPDAQPGPAAAIVARAAMGYAGQKCTATSRVVVVGDQPEFAEALVAAVRGLAVGDPAGPEVVVGPVIDEPARGAVVAAMDEARRDGGRVLSGGAVDGEGYYVRPVLIDGLPPSHRLAQEEVFGPLAVVLGARDVDEAVAIANGVRHGLAAAVLTGDLDRAMEVTSRLKAGLVKVNGPTSGVDFFAPFGGVKASSLGPREQGKAAREFYTWTQTVTVSPRG